MAAIDWAVIIDKAPELASVIIVVVFALKMVDNNRLASHKTMDEWRLWLAKMEGNWQTFLKERDEQYLLAMKEMRTASDASTARLAEEIKEIGQQMVTLSSTFTSHDSRQAMMQQQTAQIQREIELLHKDK